MSNILLYMSNPTKARNLDLFVNIMQIVLLILKSDNPNKNIAN